MTATPPPVLPELRNLKTVKQLVQEYPGIFTEGSLRWTIFNAEQNGFDTCVIRMGRRVLIDQHALRRWFAKHRGMTI